jgi:hypothetical protein
MWGMKEKHRRRLLCEFSSNVTCVDNAPTKYFLLRHNIGRRTRLKS